MKAYKEGSATPVQHPKKCVVVGGGNVAMDAARCARRLGSEVHIVYRRSMEELPARKEEVEHAQEEGIIFDLLCNPVKVLGDENGWAMALNAYVWNWVNQMKVDVEDLSKSKIRILTIDIDCMIMAIGTSPNPLIRHTTEG